MPKGQIIKVLAGFYYVDTGEKVVSCRARGKFRNRGQKPLVGDFCTFQEEKDGSGYILTLEKRYNQLERPPICNVDQALLVFSIAQPDFDQMLLDQFLAMVEYEKIKPIIIMDDNGCLKVVGKERGRKKSLNKIVDMAAKQAEGYENEIIMITHGDCPEDAEYVAKRVQEKMGIQNIYINNIGTVIGGHTGPGVVAEFCMGDKREVKL